MLALGKGLLQYQEQGFISFHMPGHKGKQEFFQGLHFPEQDVTELPDLDMLHAAQGVIAQAQQRASEVFGSDESFYLINGATVGNQAMFLSLMNSRERSREKTGSRVLIERKSHRSVMSGLVLTGLEPEYIPSVVHPEFQLPLGLDLSGVASAWERVQAVHLTYPGYYGNHPDLQRVIALRDAYAPSKSVLVDQAHGSHYLSSLFPQGALELGADLVLHSTHKTLSALTQAAILHVQGTRIQRSALRQALELLQSSSPSYLLMASLERAVEYALDTWRWELLSEAVQDLHARVGDMLRILNPRDEGRYGVGKLDWSKILVNTKPLGVSAKVCAEHLRKNYRIEPEFWNEDNILFLLGIGNTPEEVQILTEGLLSLSSLKQNKSEAAQDGFSQDEYRAWLDGNPALPPLRLSPRQAFLASKRSIPLKESLGKVVGESISPYPPGIPLIVMGEEITPEVLELLTRHQGQWQGWQDPGKTVLIIEED